MNKKQNLNTLFNPKSIAIVGASNKRGKIGAILATNLQKFGYSGKVYYVNPSYRILKLKKCYKNISEIKKEIDLAIIAVPAKFVIDVIKDGAINVKNFVVISAGFSEIGIEGNKRERELADLAKKYNINILGPNCLGFIVPEFKLNASFASGMPQAGSIAFVSQSGALAVAMMDKAHNENIRFSHVISIGNKMQIDEAQLIEYLGNDKKTSVIGMYLEGIKNGKEFLAAAQKVSRIKPIVILKAGKTKKSQNAISSHTGALAGSDEITDVAFEKAGVLRAKDLEQFFDLVTLFSFQRPPKNEKVVVVTNAGGAGVLTTDAFKDKNIKLLEINEKLKKKLKEKLPSEASVENPIDLLGDADTDRYENIFESFNEMKIGSMICVLTPQDQTPVNQIAQTLVNLKRKSNFTVVALFIGGQRIQASEALLRQNNIPNFSDPQRCVDALEKYYLWAQEKKIQKSESAARTNIQRKKAAKAIIKKVINENKKALLFKDAKEIMELYGVKVVETKTVAPASKIPTDIVFPVVAKVDSDTVLHKSDKKGVILNIDSISALEKSVAELRENFPKENIVIQKMQKAKTELIIGIKRDPIFGPIIIAGLGGIFTEIFKLVEFFMPPMSEKEIVERLEKSKIGFLFSSVRGQQLYNAKECAQIIMALMNLANEVEEIEEVDINPLFIYNTGEEALAVDIKILLKAAE